jgi:hypothetical protein
MSSDSTITCKIQIDLVDELSNTLIWNLVHNRFYIKLDCELT